MKASQDATRTTTARAQASAVRDRHDRQDGGFVDFLIVSDFIGYAKVRAFLSDPGRGSAAGSIVSYCLAITDLDPIHYSLYFEAIFESGACLQPDIDVDFCYVRRPEVIEYVTRNTERTA